VAVEGSRDLARLEVAFLTGQTPLEATHCPLVNTRVYLYSGRGIVVLRIRPNNSAKRERELYSFQ
jgi:hypothetical protein